MGIGIIMPFVSIISKPELLSSDKIFYTLYNLSGVETYQQFILLFCLVLLAFYCLKNTFLAYMYHYQNRVIFGRMHEVATSLLATYLKAPYSYHISCNSSDLQRNINHDVIVVFNWIVLQSFCLASDLLVMIVVILMLLTLGPLPTLAAMLLIAISTTIFFYVIRKKISRLGGGERRHVGNMIKTIQQALGSIKETKILCKEPFFVTTFAQYCKEYTNARRTIMTVNELPRLFLEAIAVCSMLVILVVNLLREIELNLILPSIALFAAAAFRLIPATTRIIRSTNMIRHYWPSLEVVFKDLTSLSISMSQAPQNASLLTNFNIGYEESIELDNVYFQYENSNEAVLNGVSLSIHKGQAVGFVGRSGAGKTTIVDIILGLLSPTNGRILVDGLDIRKNQKGWQKRFGYIPQQIFLTDDTVKRNIAFGVPDESIDEQRIWEVLSLVHMKAFVQKLSGDLNSQLGENGVRISGGQRQRIGIARALYFDPEILILDEATSSLDNETEQAVSGAIAALTGKKTLVIIAHRLSTVEKCDRLFLLSAGKLIAEGSYEELVLSSAEFRDMIASTESYTKRG